MTDTKNIEWPREIWMAEREDYDQGVVSAVLSEWATVPRWNGDTERDREFHRYIDADIYDSAELYHNQRRENLLTKHNAATKLMQQAHAVMRQCGWQLAPAAETDGDGVLELAAAEIEAAFGAFLDGEAV